MAGDHLTAAPTVAIVAPAVASAAPPAAPPVLADEFGTAALGDPYTVARLAPGLAFHTGRSRQLADHPRPPLQAALVAAVLDRFAAHDAAALAAAIAVIVIAVAIALRLGAARGRQHWQQDEYDGASIRDSRRAAQWET
ncbi:hypothetical protein G6F22_019617 [Rhizopus arrhizus]|nr:hypothetical protein G6F22_019617 [Rhizopus arrhizus]